ncbi:multidrug ABC transporter permease [Komagataeibacter oboediens]|uniref:Multidrug ABC transporter permease n=2 Tax=Komagataeibacter TaxID=1434011 RepID=A0A318R6D6_9PROT|nr:MULTISPECIES: HlyD family secretion protein [Komagataeibacter]PYD81763.1 multidrug ABC transporter permease [Komagataeibacter oboediens]
MPDIHQTNPSSSGQRAPDSATTDTPPEKPADPRRTAMRRLVLAGIAGLALIAFVVWLVHWWTHGRFIQSTNDAYLQADQVTVSTRVAGFVDQVLVAENQAVTKGQVLVRMDERDPRARFEQARALADQGNAAIIQTKAQIDAQDAEIAQAQARRDAAQAQVDFADRQVARYRALAATGAETNEHYDQLRNSSAQAHAQLAQATAALKSAQLQIATFRAEILQAQARIEQAIAQQRSAQVDLDATTIRAAVDGRVGDRSARVGQYAAVGTHMMTIVPVQDIYLVANFKETQIRRMRPGQPVTVSVDALGGEKIHGTVESFAPGTGAQFALLPPDNATGNFTKVVQRVPVRIHIQPDVAQRAVLIPGLSVTAAVDTLVAGTDPAPGGGGS